MERIRFVPFILFIHNLEKSVSGKARKHASDTKYIRSKDDIGP